MCPGSYQKGRTAEYYVIEKLKALGATLITRSAGSHGIADITAWFLATRQVWLIQVKTSKRAVSLDRLKKEYVGLTKLEGPWNAKAGFFIRQKDGWHSSFPV